MRYGLIALALVGGAYAGFHLSRSRWQEYFRQHDKAAHSRSEMLKLEAKKAELMKATARLETPLGMELEARRAGYHRKDEVRLNGF